MPRLRYPLPAPSFPGIEDAADLADVDDNIRSQLEAKLVSAGAKELHLAKIMKRISSASTRTVLQASLLPAELAGLELEGKVGADDDPADTNLRGHHRGPCTAPREASFQLTLNTKMQRDSKKAGNGDRTAKNDALKDPRIIHFNLETKRMRKDVLDQVCVQWCVRRCVQRCV